MKDEIIELNEQLEEGKKVEEGMRKKYLEKEEQHQKMEVEVNILKGKLEENNKHLRFQDSTKIFDNILSSQRSPSIKFGLGFHETIKGECSSKASVRNLKGNNAKPEVLHKEIRSQPNQQTRKVNLQRESSAPNYRSVNQFSPLISNVECFICHNYGHVAANCRSKLFQARIHLTTST